MKEATGKARIYTGQLICSKNYNDFTSEQRVFWQKAHKAFSRGDMYFKYKDQTNIVPFRFVDGTFDTVLTQEKITQQVKETRERLDKPIEEMEVRESLEAIK